MEKTIKEQIEKLHESFTGCVEGDCIIIIGCNDGCSFVATAGRLADIVVNIALAMNEDDQFAICEALAVAAYKECSPNAGDI
ncbi:MAG: hypothetical protein RR141_03910 [Rikenellaceae bacterium]